MCGVTGFWHWGEQVDIGSIGTRLADMIQHRGPDGSGVWTNPDIGLCLAHRRLSIIELSESGSQPMISKDGRFVLSFNGEIYNHLDIRKELIEVSGLLSWNGQSDTETLLKAIEIWGVESTLPKLNGMFAFALWDQRTKRLYLARDRVGEKPIYYGKQGKSFLFSSELRAMEVHPDWTGRICREALSLFLKYSYVPSPRSIYKDIFRLPPAHYLIVEDRGLKIHPPVPYWNLEAEIGHCADELRGTDQGTRLKTLESLLKNAVKTRMIADVPVGAFLSGGIDSSVIVALMQASSSQPVRTFTIGSKDKNLDEAVSALKIAEYLGTIHTDLTIDDSQILDVVPDIAGKWDEPFADPSQIPTYLVCALTRQHVTVALSGDGGDELFGGYNRYNRGFQTWKKLSNLPSFLRAFAQAGMSAVEFGTSDNFKRSIPSFVRKGISSEHIKKLLLALEAQTGLEYYESVVTRMKNPEKFLFGDDVTDARINFSDISPSLEDFRDTMMRLDFQTYLPDDILVKLDRASMAVSMEARVPFLDPRLVGFAFALPTNDKFRSGKSKWILRELLYNYVPRNLVDGPKLGFNVPLREWLLTVLRDWVEALLDPQVIRSQSFFDNDAVQELWARFISGQGYLEQEIWNIIVFQSWAQGKKLS